MRVAEVFRSIQGESTRAGEPCTFVRLAGCPLRCAWCDTRHAWEGGREVSAEEAVREVAATGAVPGVGHVCVTGGEPMADPDAPCLLAALAAAGHDVVLMTSGTFPLDAVPGGVRIVMDVKTPWVREAAPPADPRPGAPPPHLDPSALARMGPGDEVKLVVRSRVEFDWACAWAASAGLFGRVGAVLVGAAWGVAEPRDVADWILASGLPIRLNVQWHKVMWGEGTRR
ncbi:MAG: radical SAM protein [Deltaproteobacteria bacterium]|nr:radical SAM protein [Deltaproteobacteria bacterium]